MLQSSFTNTAPLCNYPCHSVPGSGQSGHGHFGQNRFSGNEHRVTACPQRAWHRVMGRSSPFASLYSTSAKLRPLTFTHAGSIFRMACITFLCCLPVSSAISSDVMVYCKLTICVSQRARHRVMFQFSDRWSECGFAFIYSRGDMP